ncbi:hypothetical protein [Sneathiella glossodoripedis]|uniref:hypothetical protein n=1 Tax=Sneathiella glossodoripedis TaxID=418853 RepID=UPI00131F34FE|nr:hypothetical protein [Sneathiella glossodoripedis]
MDNLVARMERGIDELILDEVLFSRGDDQCIRLLVEEIRDLRKGIDSRKELEELGLE